MCGFVCRLPGDWPSIGAVPDGLQPGHDGRFALAGFGVASQRFLGEDHFAVDGQFVDAAFGRQQIKRANINFDFTITEHFFRQTDGTFNVASGCAVFEGDVDDSELHNARLLD